MSLFMTRTASRRPSSDSATATSSSTWSPRRGPLRPISSEGCELHKRSAWLDPKRMPDSVAQSKSTFEPFGPCFSKGLKRLCFCFWGSFGQLSQTGVMLKQVAIRQSPPLEVYVNSPDGRGKRFALYSFAPHGVLSLEKKECSYSEFLDKIG